MNLWNDCSGGVITTELAVVTSMVVAGVTAGLANLTAVMNAELNDVASAIQNVNQSYGYTGIQSYDAYTAGSGFVDQRDVELFMAPSCTLVGE